MGLADIAKGLFDRKVRIDPEALRKTKPTRNTFVVAETQEDGTVILMALLSSQGRGVIGKIAQKAGKPDVKHFELETVGAFVWNLCDGKHTFEGISKKLREEFKLDRLEADASLSAFLQMLSQRKLITMMVATKK
ncbi:MAG: PqqD family protein [Chlorobia bacterium]|nr:PqqD family protein [Fimbriimonadaceae bacterium]